MKILLKESEVSNINEKKVESILDYFLSNNKFNNLQVAFHDLIKMTYVSDWIRAFMDTEELTGMEWQFDKYGPHNEWLVNRITTNQKYNITEPLADRPGYKDYFVSIKDKKNTDLSFPMLSEREKEMLDFVIKEAAKKKKNPRSFDEHVFNTFPVSQHYKDKRSQYFNLIKIAPQVQKLYKNLEEVETIAIPNQMDRKKSLTKNVVLVKRRLKNTK